MATIVNNQPVTPSTPVKKNTGLDAGTHFLKLGAATYKLTKVSHPINDLEKEIRQYYKNVYEQLANSTGDMVVTSVNAVHQSNINRIQDFINRNRTGVIKLPPDLQGCPIMYAHNTFWMIKPMIYYPLIHKTCKRRLLDMSINLNQLPLPQNINEDTKLTIILKSVPAVIMLLGYSQQKNLLSTPLVKTFHTMTEYNKLCTGNAVASSLWNMPPEELQEYLNTINHFSLARSDVQGFWDTPKVQYHLRDIIKPDNINSITVGGDKWRT